MTKTELEKGKNRRAKSALKRLLYGFKNFLKVREFKKEHKYFVDGEAVLRRKSDGTLWISSHNGRAAAMTALFAGETLFYFRRCKPFADGYIIDWEQVWEFHDVHKFEIYDNRKAI